jgi:ribosomal protein S18 acetylase RimI-like enzyme
MARLNPAQRKESSWTNYLPKIMIMMKTAKMPADKPQSAWIEKVILRRLRRADLPELEWDGEYTRFRKLYESAFERSQMGQSVLWIAEHPEFGIIGQLFIQLVSDNDELADGSTKAYLYAFRIRPQYRCEGLGTFMMHVAEADLIRRSFKVITLNVTQDNLDAIRLYERCGYKITGPDAGRWSYPDHEGVWRTVEEASWRMEKQIAP